MRPLNASKRLFTFLCVLPFDSSETRWIKFRNIFITSTLFGFMIVANISSIVYIIKYARTSIADALYAGHQSSALSASTYTILAAYLLRQSMIDIFAAFQNFYDKCNF